MSYNFSSKMKHYLEQMIIQKRALGSPYVVSEQILAEFDRFCVSFFPDAETITPNLGSAWAVIRPTEKTNSFKNRIAPVRELAKFMNRSGVVAYIIPSDLVPKDGQRRVPHIFTFDELRCFFEVVDTLPITPRSRLRHLQVPVIFRLMYACGLRPHEARTIKTKNMNLETGTLIIPESKGHKDRIIVMSQDLTQICFKYYHFLQKEYPNGEHFFPCQRYGGRAYEASW